MIDDGEQRTAEREHLRPRRTSPTRPLVLTSHPHRPRELRASLARAPGPGAALRSRLVYPAPRGGRRKRRKRRRRLRAGAQPRPRLRGDLDLDLHPRPGLARRRGRRWGRRRRRGRRRSRSRSGGGGRSRRGPGRARRERLDPRCPRAALVLPAPRLLRVLAHKAPPRALAEGARSASARSRSKEKWREGKELTCTAAGPPGQAAHTQSCAPCRSGTP